MCFRSLCLQASADLLYQVDEQSSFIRSLLVLYTSRQHTPAAASTNAKPTPTTSAPAPKPAASKASPAPPTTVSTTSTTKTAVANDDDDDDDDFISSLSDDDDDEDSGAAAQALIAKKNAEREAAKRATKGGPQAKSSLILDVKPEDSDTDMDALAKQVKAIEMQGLTWGNFEFIPVAFGIRKLRIICVVVDDLVSTDDLQEQIEALEGVQSTDIHAFNKL